MSLRVTGFSLTFYILVNDSVKGTAVNFYSTMPSTGFTILDPY